MAHRKPFNFVIAGALIISLLLGLRPIETLNSATPPPPPPVIQENGLNYVDGRVTPRDIEEAAKSLRAQGYLPGLAGVDPNLVQMAQGEIPHYYGPFPNYANSPMPKGSIGTITVDDPGSGYTAPTVSILDVYATGSGATATATTLNGQITEITVTSPGTNYTAPIVVIEDPTGVDAWATANLNAASLTGGIRKFVDSLPGLDAAAANNLGQYLPIAIPDTTTYPGDHYYEIELGKYEEQLHSDLPPTTLYGYRQTNAPDPAVNQFQHLGPMIIAEKDIPVRIKFTNSLPANGDFFLPVDTTLMGAGQGPLKADGFYCDPMMIDPMPSEECQYYSVNRTAMHLHGGFVPWISDGTPHQWTTPAGEDTLYPEGVSVEYIPDMWFENGNVIPDTIGQSDPPSPTATNDPGDGSLTFYYNNQNSARLMFYHDHAFGITRLNVYAGVAAGYILTDFIEQDLINGTNNSGVNPGLVQILPDYGIPLILTEKTFVDATTIAAQDPTWAYGSGAIDPITGYPTPKTGDLWVSTVYMPAQNPWDNSGSSAFGRWQYGPYFWPPTENIDYPPVENPYYDPTCDFAAGFCEPPLIPGTPSPSVGMEAFNDTPLVNGTVYPYLEVDPELVRFRILNAANDRFFNLQFYVADPTVVTGDGRMNTEVKMVPAVETPGFPANWPTDNRAGGAPDPATIGPDWIVIGNEGGFLPEPAIVPAQPVLWEMDPTLFNVGNVSDHSLLLGNAERADVLVDFSQYAGQTLILYNDAPAAFPALDPRYDYYTGAPDLTSSGGVPTVHAGYGPNTRTIMQIRVRPGAGVPGGASVTSVNVISGGTGYTTMPSVNFAGGGGTGAAATATGSVENIAVVIPGSGLIGTPTVTLTGGGGTGATAIANVINGSIASFTVTNGGSGYTSAPTVEITTDPFVSTHTIYLPLIYKSEASVSPPPSVPVGAATLRVSAIALTNGGSNYTTAPTVDLVGGGGTGATAIANIGSIAAYDPTPLMETWAKSDTKPGVFETGQDRMLIPQYYYNSAYNDSFPADSRAFVTLADLEKSFFNGPLTGLTVTNGGSGYTTASVTITGGGGSGATADATITAGVITGLVLTNPGTNYSTQPTVSIIGDGTGATATADPITIWMENKAIQDEMGESFDEYGRMSGFLGLELPFTMAGQQNFVLYPHLAPPTELVMPSDLDATQLGSLEDGTQIWKITHNGVDTHPIHVHLFNVQIINRMAWDGQLLEIHPTEYGWKETFRVHPLQHTVVAFRPTLPTQPFEVPNSIRLIDPTMPEGYPVVGGPLPILDPIGELAPVLNHYVNLGWEYVWHCHILSHEEMDMMRPLTFAVPPYPPIDLASSSVGMEVTLSWTDGSNTETGFTVLRADTPDGPWIPIATVPAVVGKGSIVEYVDELAGPGPGAGTYYYQVVAANVIGDTVVYPAPSIGFPTLEVKSDPTNTVTITVP